MTNDIQLVHGVLLEHLDYLDSICREHDIEYTLYAGTLLGAIRQKGFISWDDDADVAMTRENFERFISIHLSKGSNSISIERDGLWVYRCRILRAAIDKGSDETDICSDIFILDAAPSNPIIFWAKIAILLFLQAMIKPEGVSRNRGLLWNILQVFPFVIGRAISHDYKLRLYDKISQWGQFGGTSKYHHSSNDQFRYLPLRYKKEAKNCYEDREFEGRHYRVAGQWDEILVKMYGEDYLTPPPLEERVPMHVLKRHNEP